MTLLIDGYTIIGTPEEINTFIKIYKQKDTNTNTNIGCPTLYWKSLCTTYIMIHY